MTEPAWVPSFLGRRPRARAAFALAERWHAGTRRDVDGAPFLLHPLKVAALLHAVDADEPTVAAGLLHDVVEKTSATAADVREQAGADVAAVVEGVTEDPSIEGYRERKAAHREHVRAAGPAAALVFAADKLAKAREMRHLRPPEPEAALRLEHYRESLAVVEERLGEHALVEQLRFEIEALEALPPRP